MTTTTPKSSPKRETERRRKKAAETTGGRLGVNPALLDHDKYAYRFFNDDPGRIVSKTRMDDWDLIPNEGEKEDSTDLGSMVSVIVGAKPDGSPKRAFLARKLKTFYEQDKAEGQKALDKQLAELKRGKARDGSSQSDYVPNSGISME